MTNALRSIAERYDAALRGHLAGRGEASLEEAYAVGRDAVERGLGVLDMAAVHQQALTRAIAESPAGVPDLQLLEKAAVFFTESLATLEMAHRGYQEANAALKALNETLERRVEMRTAELQASEARYRALVDGLDAVVWEADLERERFTFVSHRAESLLGFPASDFEETTNFWGQHVHPEDFERVLELRRAAGPDNRDHVLEYRFKASDGRWVWLRDVVRVLRDAGGKPERLTGVMIDVSEIVAIQQYRENLIDVISHEFRTPVTVIQGYAQLLTEGKSKISRQTAATAEERIRMASQHLSYLLGSITELSRLRSGGPPPHLEPLATGELIKEAVAALSARGRATRGSVEIHVSEGAERVIGDRRKLVISLVELLDNAVKFSPPGLPILVGARVKGDETVLTVEDRGPGIPDEMRDQLFKPFVQADMSSVRSTGGAGLGLAVVSGLVKAQGGRVEVESVVGEGSAFHIVLPRSVAARPPENHAPRGSRGASADS